MYEDIPCEPDDCDTECTPSDSEKATIVNVDFPDDIVEIIRVGRESNFGKRVARCLIESKSEMKINPKDIDNVRFLFFEMFGVQPTSATIVASSDIYMHKGKKIDTDWRMVDAFETARKMVEQFKGGGYYIRFDDQSNFVLYGEGIIVRVYTHAILCVYDPVDPSIMDRVVDSIVAVPSDGKKEIGYVVFDHGFNVTYLKVKKQECTVSDNYNDDLPDDRIVSWINSEESGVVVLHGEPGTGKTSYIRNLIYRTDNRFLFFDKSIFQHMSDSSLIELLMSHRNSVIILEDCEDLLTNRTGFGSCMSTILNLTDGILGDAMNFKFICTFNADIVDIDPAILRKGRMRLKYEFKKLAGKKAKALGEKLGIQGVLEKDMPLCEVYNYLVDNGNNKKETKVGF